MTKDRHMDNGFRTQSILAVGVVKMPPLVFVMDLSFFVTKSTI